MFVMNEWHRLMSEFLQCQDGLVRSACGSSLADFILAVSVENHIRLATDNELRQQHCQTDTIMLDYPVSDVGQSPVCCLLLSVFAGHRAREFTLQTE